MLARVCQAGGQTDRALELLEHIVALRERTLSEEHPDRLASQHEYTIAYRMHHMKGLYRTPNFWQTSSRACFISNAEFVRLHYIFDDYVYC